MFTSLTAYSHAPTSAISKSLAATIRSKYPSQSHPGFNVEITESKPTVDQLRIIQNAKGAPKGFEAMPGPGSGNPVAASYAAENADSEDGKTNKIPILVDWDNGKVAVDNEDRALEILRQRANEK